MKKLLITLILSAGLLFASMNLNTASKQELMSIKGVGEVKASRIIKYRKNNKIYKIEDLKSIKGFGPSLINNIKKDIKLKNKSNKVKSK